MRSEQQARARKFHEFITNAGIEITWEAFWMIYYQARLDERRAQEGIEPCTKPSSGSDEEIC